MVTPAKDRRCAFCGDSGGMTKEHVWPQWLRQHAGEVEPVRFAHSAGFERSAADAFREMPTLTVQRPGSVLNLVARAVCARCNSGRAATAFRRRASTSPRGSRASAAGSMPPIQRGNC